MKFKRKPLAIRSKYEWTLKKSASGLKIQEEKQQRESNEAAAAAAVATAKTTAPDASSILFSRFQF